MSRTKSEQCWEEKTAAPQGAAGSIAGRLLPPSMRGECRGIRLHRRLGGDRSFGRLGLLLVPFDRLPACAGAPPRPPPPPPRPEQGRGPPRVPPALPPRPWRALPA